jgi:predicted RNase H-like HicB family nuclease
MPGGDTGPCACRGCYNRRMKTLADYTVVVTPDGGTFLAYAPAIDGCYAVGKTPDEARSELEHVFGMIRDEHAEEGRELPQDVGELVFADAVG